MMIVFFVILEKAAGHLANPDVMHNVLEDWSAFFASNQLLQADHIIQYLLRLDVVKPRVELIQYAKVRHRQPHRCPHTQHVDYHDGQVVFLDFRRERIQNGEHPRNHTAEIKTKHELLELLAVVVIFQVYHKKYCPKADIK